MTALPLSWESLRRYVNSEPPMLGTRGVRDAEHPPEAPRFVEYGRAGRADRLRLFWSRKRP
jgi:hypothetical protein